MIRKYNGMMKKAMELFFVKLHFIDKFISRKTLLFYLPVFFNPVDENRNILSSIAVIVPESLNDFGTNRSDTGAIPMVTKGQTEINFQAALNQQIIN